MSFQLVDRVRLLVLLMLAVSLPGCGGDGGGGGGGGGGNVSLGNVSGDIKFVNVTSGGAVSGYLASRTIAAGASDAVRLYEPANPPTIAATSGYQAASLSSGSDRRVSTYAITPPASAASGTVFTVEIDSVRFTGTNEAAQYRFGTRFAGTTSTQQTPPVTTLAVRKDIGEKACLVRATLKFDGADVNELSPSEPITCTVFASVQEAGSFNAQASAVRSALVRNDLTRPEGQLVEMLVRADGSALNSGAACATRPPSGSSFAVNDQGVAAFSAPFAISANCTDAHDVTVEIPVLRQSGNVKGVFNISNEGETDARIVLFTPPPPPWAPWGFSRTTTPPLFPAGQHPDPSNPNHQWSITGVPPGTYDVYAYAGLRDADGGDGNVTAVLPHKTGVNTPVTIPPPVGGSPQTVDLGSTFVTTATRAHGRVLLRDPSGRTNLAELKTGKLPLSDGPWWEQWSFVRAVGKDGIISQQQTGGFGGATFGRLREIFDPESAEGCRPFPRECQLGYSLAFTGLSPSAGAADGSNTQITGWNVDGLRLSFGNRISNFSQTFATLAQEREGRTPSEANPLPEFEPIDACFGQVELDVRIDPATGTLFRPSFNADSVQINGGTALSRFQISAEGMPKLAGFPGSARVSSPAASRMRYLLNPKVSVAAASGSQTEITLPNMTLPGADAVLACGQIARACIKINDASGASSPLSVSARDDVPTCTPGGVVNVTVTVDSGGADVDSLTYQVEGQSPRTICSPCLVNPVTGTVDGHIPAAGESLTLTDGQTITITAAGNGCEASTTYRVNATCTPEEPVHVRKYHIAFFDQGVLRVHDAMFGTTAFAVPMSPGPIRYAPDGSKLAVVAANEVKIVDADLNPAFPTLTFAGQHSDAAFPPTASNRLALIQRQSETGYFLSIIGVGPGAPATVGLAVTLGFDSPNLGTAAQVSLPMLAWSQTGDRVTIAYIATTTNDQRFLRTMEWRVDAGGLTPDRSGTFPFPAGENFVRFGYDDNVAYLVVTSQAVYRIGAQGVLTPLPGYISQIAAADLHRPGVVAVAPAQGPVQLRDGATSVTEPGGAGVQLGGIAVSDYAFGLERFPPWPALAVARRYSVATGVATGGVNIYFFRAGTPGFSPALTLLRGITAGNPRYPAFRPDPRP
jgi:hypothetical protein